MRKHTPVVFKETNLRANVNESTLTYFGQIARALCADAYHKICTSSIVVYEFANGKRVILKDRYGDFTEKMRSCDDYIR